MYEIEDFSSIYYNISYIMKFYNRFLPCNRETKFYYALKLCTLLIRLHIFEQMRVFQGLIDETRNRTIVYCRNKRFCRANGLVSNSESALDFPRAVIFFLDFHPVF